jgi:TonB family protein
MHKLERKKTARRLWVGTTISILLNMVFLTALVFLTGYRWSTAPDVRLIEAPVIDFFEEPQQKRLYRPEIARIRKTKPCPIKAVAYTWRSETPALPKPRTSFDFPREQLKAGLRIPLLTEIGDIEIPTASLAPDSPKITFELADVDTPPQLTGGAAPSYPPLARERGIEGKVRVRFLVERDGNISRVKILSAIPQDVFDEAVKDTVKKWRFAPGKVKGKKVRTWCVQEISFSLED